MNNNASNSANESIKSPRSEPASENASNEAFFLRLSQLAKFNGIFLALVSALAITASTFMIKLSLTLNSAEMASVKFLVQTIFCMPFAYFYKTSLLGPKEARLILILRGLAGSISIIAAYFSIKMITFGESMSIRYSSPIVTALFASLFLKEKLSPILFVSLALSLIGVLCVTRPSAIFRGFGQLPGVESSTNFRIGLGLASISALIGATTFVFVKKLTNKNIHFSIIIFYYSLFGCLFSFMLALMLYFTGGRFNLTSELSQQILLRDLAIAILAGVINFAGHICFTFALRSENVNKIALIRTLDIFVAFFIEYAILGVVPAWMTLVGSGVMLISVSIIFIYRLVLLERKLVEHNFYA